jgi:glutamine synthetase
MAIKAANQRVRMLFCDHLNLARGKYIPMPKSKTSHGARFCRGVFGVAYDKELIPAPGAISRGGYSSRLGARYQSGGKRFV